MLYLVATPIGHLQDITLRALETLKSADYILAEDTRKTGLMLLFHKVSPHPPLISFHEYNEQSRLSEILQYLKNDKNVALVSNAGTPGLSDPGFKLIRECLQNGLKVEAIPGPSAVITALVLSGLPTDKFFFLGFLPRKSGPRQNLFRQLLAVNQCLKTTYIAFESPYRLQKTLEDLQTVLGDVSIAVGREMTKMHEEVFRGPIREAINFFLQKPPKGEITLVFRLAESSPIPSSRAQSA